MIQDSSVSPQGGEDEAGEDKRDTEENSIEGSSLGEDGFAATITADPSGKPPHKLLGRYEAGCCSGGKGSVWDDLGADIRG